jgi:hypothetical protein
MKGSYKVTFTKISDNNWIFTVYNGSLYGNPSKAGDFVFNYANYNFNPPKGIFKLPTEWCNEKGEYRGDIYLPKVVMMKNEFSEDLLQAIEDGYIQDNCEYDYYPATKQIGFTKKENILV